VEIYNSEEQQVEALKEWWDKNGKSVLLAIAVVLLSVFGWKSWMQHKQAKAEGASIAFQQMMDLLPKDPAKAMEAGHAITGEYTGTVYSTMASLAMARIAIEKDDLDGAAAHLKVAAEHASQPELKLIARLRLSKVLQAQGKAAEAMAQVQGVQAGALQAEFDEQRGDLLVAAGKKAEARDAYTNALAGYADVPDKHELVQLKLDDIAESKGE
jgi:predicted negative regulator of RcsB-dependent stress response